METALANICHLHDAGPYRGLVHMHGLIQSLKEFTTETIGRESGSVLMARFRTYHPGVQLEMLDRVLNGLHGLVLEKHPGRSVAFPEIPHDVTRTPPIEGDQGSAARLRLSERDSEVFAPGE